MSRTRRFLSAVSLGYASQALTMLTGLWLTPFLLWHIGKDAFGLWLLGTQLIFYLMLLDVGVVALLPRATAYTIGRAGSVENATDLPRLISQTARLVLWQMPAVIIAALVIFFLIPPDWAALRGPLEIILTVFVLFFPCRIFQAVLQGLQDLSFVSATQIVTWALNMLLTIGLILAGWRLYALAAGWVVGQVIAPLVFWWRLHRRFPQVLPARLPSLAWAQARQSLSQGFWMSVAQVAQVMLTGTDLLIIGKLLGPMAVVLYVCTGKLISVLANQPNLLMQTAVPALSELRAGASHERLLQVSSVLSLAMLTLSGAVICLVLVVNQGFVFWWVGKEQFGGLGLTALFLSALLLRHWNITWIYTLFSFGHERHIAVTALLDGLLTTISALVLVKLWGLKGGPLGAILGVCLVSLPRNLSKLLRELEIPPDILLRTLWPWFWRFGGLVLLSGVVAQLWVPDSFLKLAVTATLAVLIYTVVMLPMALQSSLAPYLRPRLDLLRVKLLGSAQSNPVA